MYIYIETGICYYVHYTWTPSPVPGISNCEEEAQYGTQKSKHSERWGNQVKHGGNSSPGVENITDNWDESINVEGAMRIWMLWILSNKFWMSFSRFQ